MGKLVHFLADGTAVEVKLDRQRITIGRRPDNDFCLPHPAVSGEHAAVVTILADSFLEDLGSTNGTLVNGTPIAKHFLRDRDRIDVGQQILIYLVDDAATVETPPGSTRMSEGSGQDERAEGTLVVPGGLRPKRRSDFVAAVPVVPDGMAAPPADPANAESADAASELGAAAARAAAPPNVEPPVRRIEGEPALKVVSGAKAGRIVALVKDETLIGRPGVQVVAVRRDAAEVRVVPVEGATLPSVNGTQVAPEGRALALGDVLEVAGTRLEVISAMKRPSA